MIAENAYLIPEKDREEYAQKNRYLATVKDLQSEMNDEDDKVCQLLDSIKIKLNKKVNGIYKNADRLRD